MLRRPLEFTQYTSIAFGLRCREVGVRPSMGSVGDAYDNALCESFFATLECELLDRKRFQTQAEAKMAAFAFIEGFYNPRRRHSSLGQVRRSTSNAAMPGRPPRERPLRPILYSPAARGKLPSPSGEGCSENLSVHPSTKAGQLQT